MKRMITALCAMMLVPTLAAAKNEGISVTELREQIETLGRWTASYTDVTWWLRWKKSMNILISVHSPIFKAV